MNSFNSDVQLKSIDVENKDLVAFYGHSMRSISNLKIIKMAHTKFQTHSYFSGDQYSNTLQEFLSSSQLLFQYREVLFFSLRQLFLSMRKILTVLQWMSPGIDKNTKRSADHHILKIVLSHQKQGKTGPLTQKIYIIEIERMLKVVQFDQKEISLKILYDLAKQMDCLIKSDKEYVFYDKFFYCLSIFFKQEQLDSNINKVEYERKMKLEARFSIQPQGLRKIGVVNDYQEQFEDLDGEFYDSIANLLYSKGQNDYMNYVFMGFTFTTGDPLKINAIYGNATTKCKLYLRPNLISQQFLILTPSRPQSPYDGMYSKQTQSFKSDRNQKIIKSTLPTTSKCIIPPKMLYICTQEPLQYCAQVVLQNADDLFQCQAQRSFSIEQTGINQVEIQKCPLQLQESIPYKSQKFYKFFKGSTIFGVAKPEILLELSSGSEAEEEVFDQIDKPIQLDTSKLEDEKNKIKENGWKGLHNRGKSSKKGTRNMVDKIEIINSLEEDEPYLKGLLNNLQVPYAPRTIDFQFAEYEVELSPGDNDMDINQSDIIELDLSQFGFATTMLFHVYSCEYVRAIRISFPESKIQLPLMYFPNIETKDVYDLHTWHIGPIDNIKGLQIQKKRIQGREFVKNFVFLVQDNDKSRLTCYNFEYKPNQSLQADGYNQIIPSVSNVWRQGQFRIFLNFILNKADTKNQLDTIVLLLKKLNFIFQQMFPGLIIEENIKKLRPNCVFEVYLQSMGRPHLRDNYDRYYLTTVQFWSAFVEDFDGLVTGLIDNLTILIWSYGGIENLHLMEVEINKRQSGKVTKSYPYKYVQNNI